MAAQPTAGLLLRNHPVNLVGVGEKEGRKRGGEERAGLAQSRDANLSKHSSLRVAKAEMLRTPIPRGGLSWEAPWLPTSSGTFCLCLTFLLDQVGLLQGHPQCLDYGPPFRPSLHLEFCSDYESFGCCDQRKDRRIAARYRDIMGYFDGKGRELCGRYIKDILCQVGLGVKNNPEGSEGAGLEKFPPAQQTGVLAGWLGPWEQGSWSTRPPETHLTALGSAGPWRRGCAELGCPWFPKALPWGSAGPVLPPGPGE